MYKRKEVIGACTLYLGDSAEILPTLGKFDALVTDPPYGIGAGGGFSNGGKRFGNTKTYERAEWDNQRPEKQLFDLLLSSAKTHIIWGGNYFTDYLPVSGKWLFWDKCQTMPTYSDGELAWTSIDGVAVKQFTYNGNGMTAKEKERFHPTQKPVELMKWCLGFLPNARTIIDPFSGSFSTGVACVKAGKDFVGIEMDEKYFDIGCKRIEEAMSQPDMFIDKPKPMEQVSLL